MKAETYANLRNAMVAFRHARAAGYLAEAAQHASAAFAALEEAGVMGDAIVTCTSKVTRSLWRLQNEAARRDYMLKSLVHQVADWLLYKAPRVAAAVSFVDKTKDGRAATVPKHIETHEAALSLLVFPIEV